MTKELLAHPRFVSVWSKSEHFRPGVIRADEPGRCLPADNRRVHPQAGPIADLCPLNAVHITLAGQIDVRRRRQCSDDRRWSHLCNGSEHAELLYAGDGAPGDCHERQQHPHDDAVPPAGSIRLHPARGQIRRGFACRGVHGSLSCRVECDDQPSVENSAWKLLEESRGCLSTQPARDGQSLWREQPYELRGRADVVDAADAGTRVEGTPVDQLGRSVVGGRLGDRER